MWPSEKQFADLLDKQGRKWEYPARRFKLKNTTYQPDFFLPNENLYIEVVGYTNQSYQRNKHKYLELKRIYPNIHFIVVDYKGNPFESNYNGKGLKKEKVCLTTTLELIKKVQQEAIKQNRSMSNLVETILRGYFKRQK